MSKLKFNITMSLDGFVAGPKQSEQDPLSVGGMELHRWMLPLAAFREMQGEEGGEVNASTPVVKGLFERRRDRDGPQHVRRRSRPVGENPWNGWWGDDPLELEQIRAIEAPGVTHLKYRVQRR